MTSHEQAASAAPVAALRRQRVVPPDSHVHSEWSWDAPRGAMIETCEQAIRVGLRSLAFTDHADFTNWVDTRDEGTPTRGARAIVNDDAIFVPDLLDVDGYLAALEECRHRFPELRILSGVELGEPHWHKDESDALIGHGNFDRVLISLHSALGADGRLIQVRDAYFDRPAPDVVRTYLADAIEMVENSAIGSVLAHIDYPVRAWPDDAPNYSPTDFEEEFRALLRALAQSGRALELNTRTPLDQRVVTWWAEEGGELMSFGSDAHEPMQVGRGFTAAAARVEAVGFRPGRDPHDFWHRGRRASGSRLS
jgi:histidinol-phosphatase (PHP family)